MNVWEGEGYRVRFSDEIQGIPIRPHYHALVQTEFGWLFAGRRGPYYSLNQAIKACERHRRYWIRALKIMGRKRHKGKKAKLDALKANAQVGKGVTLNRLLNIRPLWTNQNDLTNQ